MFINANLPLHTVDALQTYEPTIGRWLWQLEDTRRQTKEALKDLSPAALDWIATPDNNSIGTLLYHIALIETDWLYTEVLEYEPWPQELKELFTIDVRDEKGRLSLIQGVSLEEHLRRLDLARTHVMAAFQHSNLDEFRCSRVFPEYLVSAEWVLYHLIQHETEHRGHIQLLRSLAERELAVS